LDIQDLFNAFEVHDAATIDRAFRNGMDPNLVFEGRPLVWGLIDMYLRGPGFKDCFRVFVDHGLNMEDDLLQAVLLDDADSLRAQLKNTPSLIHKRYTFRCTFTPLQQASLLHLCAEYNLPDCGAALIAQGVGVNTSAGLDEHGFGGQSPIFHTVNQHANACMEMLKLLLANGADPAFPVKGLIWGKGYPWETYIPSVDPVSYAMMGLLRQFQRTEKDIYEVVDLLMKARHGITYQPVNVPNAYLGL